MKKLLLSLSLITSISAFAQTNTSSISFDGVDDFILVQDDPSLNLDQSDFSIFAWVKASSFDDEGIFDHLDIPGTSCSRINFRIDIDGKLRVSLKDESCNYFNATTNYIFSDSEWHFVAVSFGFSSETVNFYIDGQLEPHTIIDQDGFTSGINPGGILQFGKYGNTEFTNGQIDDISLWNIVLTEQEIQDYMNCPPTGSETGLVGYWNFEEGTGTTAGDLTSNANDGTLTNGPTWSTDVPAYNCNVGIGELTSENKEVVKIVNLLGQEVEYTPNTVLIYVYSDGTSERVFKLEE